ncbi:hypothetical protein AAF302_000678 [Pluralibacter gergoviae]
MSKSTGGSAFPVDRQCAHAQAVAAVGTEDEAKYIEEVNRVSGGMTLRDYFAANAMQAMISNPAMIDCDTDCAVNYAASASYKFADAMLKAREIV